MINKIENIEENEMKFSEDYYGITAEEYNKLDEIVDCGISKGVILITNTPKLDLQKIIIAIQELLGRELIIKLNKNGNWVLYHDFGEFLEEIERAKIGYDPKIGE